MNPQTEGLEEQGPNRVPYINDPDKKPQPKHERERPDHPATERDEQDVDEG